MQLRTCLSLLFASVTFQNATPSAEAWLGLGKFTVSDGSGDQVVVKHGLFGRKTVVSDQNGDGFEHSKSIFGLTKDTKVGVLGNEVHSHKGLLGFSKTEGQSALGDSVTSSKNPLYRNTNINLQGIKGMLDKYSRPKPSNASLPSTHLTPQGQSNNATPPATDGFTNSVTPVEPTPTLR